MTSVYQKDLDRQLFIRLHENEIDLQTQLSDLSDEIVTREAQVVETLAQLRRTREHMRRLLRETPGEGVGA